MGLHIDVRILNASDVGGVYPFVVVCFDGDIENELFKTEATMGGKRAVWNASFPLDLTSLIKKRVKSGAPEPTYLTFFLFDTGTAGIPSLGSAGVLLSTVRDTGRAQGDFVVVNGTGTLSLSVTKKKEEEEGFLHSDKAKVAGVVGGVTALAAGLGAAALHSRKKKKKQEAGENEAGGGSGGGDSDAQNGEEDGDDSSTDHERAARPWWDPRKGQAATAAAEEEENEDEDEDEGEDEQPGEGDVPPPDNATAEG